MNTVELATLALLKATDRDLSSLSVEESLTLVDAMNSSIQTFFEKAPDIYKRTTVSHLVKESERVQFTVTSDSSVITTNAFLASQRGCSLEIDGDGNLNEIVDVNKMLLPYKGASGLVNGTIYYDVVTFKDFLLERVTSDPIVIENNCQLFNTEQFKTGASQGSAPWYGQANNRVTGTYPLSYYVQYVGGSIQVDNDAIFQLRLDPIPTTKCILRFEADIRPVAYNIIDLEAPLNLPVPTTAASRTVVPLMAEKLLGTALWDRDKIEIIEGTRKAGSEAMRDIENLPAIFGAPRGKIRTRRGY